MSGPSMYEAEADKGCGEGKVRRGPEGRDLFSG